MDHEPDPRATCWKKPGSGWGESRTMRELTRLAGTTSGASSRFTASTVRYNMTRPRAHGYRTIIAPAAMTPL